MPTSWTKTTDNSTTWDADSGYPTEAILEENSEELLSEDGLVLNQEIFDTQWNETADKSTPWSTFFGLVNLVTEGLRELLTNESGDDYIVVSHGSEVDIWTDVADNSTAWTKISDI